MIDKGLADTYYVALTHNQGYFRYWCNRWSVDNEIIFVVDPGDVDKEMVSEIEKLEEFSLILFDGWSQVKKIDRSFVFYLQSTATRIHFTEIERPHALAGYILDWKLIGKGSGSKRIGGYEPWTQEKDNLLREKYSDWTMYRLTRVFGCSQQDIREAAVRLQLKGELGTDRKFTGRRYLRPDERQ